MWEDDRIIWLYDNANGTTSEKIQEDEHVANWGGIEAYTRRLESKGWYLEPKVVEAEKVAEVDDDQKIEEEETTIKKKKKKND